MTKTVHTNVQWLKRSHQHVQPRDHTLPYASAGCPDFRMTHCSAHSPHHQHNLLFPPHLTPLFPGKRSQLLFHDRPADLPGGKRQDLTHLSMARRQHDSTPGCGIIQQTEFMSVHNALLHTKRLPLCPKNPAYAHCLRLHMARSCRRCIWIKAH